MSSKMRYPSDKIIVPFLDYRYLLKKIPLRTSDWSALIAAYADAWRQKNWKNENKIESTSAYLWREHGTATQCQSYGGLYTPGGDGGSKLNIICNENKFTQRGLRRWVSYQLTWVRCVWRKERPSWENLRDRVDGGEEGKVSKFGSGATPDLLYTRHESRTVADKDMVKLLVRVFDFLSFLVCWGPRYRHRIDMTKFM